LQCIFQKGMSPWKLARDAHTTTVFAAAKGIGVVLTAMTAHSTVVQEQGCLALIKLTQSDTTLRNRIEDEGGLVVNKKTCSEYKNKKPVLNMWQTIVNS